MSIGNVLIIFYCLLLVVWVLTIPFIVILAIRQLTKKYKPVKWAQVVLALFLSPLVSLLIFFGGQWYMLVFGTTTPVLIGGIILTAIIGLSEYKRHTLFAISYLIISSAMVALLNTAIYISH